METVLEMNGISKVYPNGVYANKDVDFSVRKGEIHALVGENGAGKSTLMKILFGLEQADTGNIKLNGEIVDITKPGDAIDLGIGMVHQHFMLVDSLTVAENTALGTEITKGLFIDKETINKKVKEISDLYNFALNPNDLVGNLSVGSKQRVEILKTLYRSAKVIILDEPTAVLTPQETKELFERLLTLKEEGHTIIFISHKLDEIKQITDRVTILRRGEMICTVNTKDVTEREISNLMIGDEVDLLSKKSDPNPKDTILDLAGVSYTLPDGYKALNDIYLKVRSGEIVGLAGIEGNGQKELIDIITGFLPYEGSAKFMDEPIVKDEIADLRSRGLCYIPSDRMTKGAILSMSIEENLIANRVRGNVLHSNLPFILSKEKIAKYADESIEDFDIRTDSRTTPMSMLSGGNMQKVVVAREFSDLSHLVVADQPTRGIDVVAADSIHRMLVKKREEGAGVLLVSADLEELITVSDSIVVIYSGEIVAYLPKAEEVTQMQLGDYMLGANRMDANTIRRNLYGKTE